MKKVSLLFLVSFSFFVIGQILWSIGMLCERPLLVNHEIEEWLINLCFTFCSIFGLLGSYKWYKNS